MDHFFRIIVFSEQVRFSEVVACLLMDLLMEHEQYALVRLLSGHDL